MSARRRRRCWICPRSESNRLRKYAKAFFAFTEHELEVPPTIPPRPWGYIGRRGTGALTGGGGVRRRRCKPCGEWRSATCLLYVYAPRRTGPS